MKFINSTLTAVGDALCYIHSHSLKFIIAGALLVIMGFSLSAPRLTVDADNGGLFLPDGFKALVVVDSLKGQARHIAVNSNGDIYVKARNHRSNDGYGNIAIRDTNGDGRADII